ncbi:MAG TPA: hypothetical protein VGO92_14635 [Acidimicrobiales bacterium]|jgi:hypothetical protein|nr:hypothetical protein [Acidimicrobiales bacterium]
MIRFLLRNGLRKGLLGGSRVWLVLGGAGLLVKVLRKLGGREPQVVYSEELPVGQAVLIANEPR